MTKAVLKLIAILIGLMAVGFAFICISDWKSHDLVLEQMDLVQPGVKLDSIKDKLGQDEGVISDPDRMIQLGGKQGVQNRSFLEGKKLHRFHAGLTSQELWVYTDQNDIVVYVSWYQE